MSALDEVLTESRAANRVRDAAPDLLAVAKHFEDLIRNGNFIGSEDLQRLQGSIAKAEGR